MGLCPGWLTHRVNSDKVQSLFVTVSYFLPYRFAQLLSLIPILLLLLYLLSLSRFSLMNFVSGDSFINNIIEYQY